MDAYIRKYLFSNIFFFPDCGHDFFGKHVDRKSYLFGAFDRYRFRMTPLIFKICKISKKKNERNTWKWD